MRCERYFYSDHGRTLWVKCKSPSNLGVLWERISVSFIIFLTWCVKKTFIRSHFHAMVPVIRRVFIFQELRDQEKPSSR